VLTARGAYAAHLPEVLITEVSRTVLVRLRAGHHAYRTAVTDLSAQADFRRLLDAKLREVPLRPDGQLLTDRLEQRLNSRPTVGLDIIPLVASRCGHNSGQIE